jgi:tetratricopeptide (TPR) repeat protein
MRKAIATCCIATLLVAQPVWAQGVPVYEASAADSGKAEKQFREGNKLYEAGQHEKAIEAFRASHAIVRSPNSSLMIARAYRDMGQLGEAHAAYRVALAEAEDAASHKDKYKKTLAAIQQELAELEAVTARLRIDLSDAPEGTEILIDDDPIPADKLDEEILMSPGEVTVVARDPSGRERREKVNGMAGQSATVKISFSEPQRQQVDEPIEINPFDEKEPAADKEPESGGGSGRTFAYIAGGVGIAGLATFGIFGAMSQSTYDDLDAECIDDHCAPSRRSDIDQGKQFQTIANIGLAVGIVGVATGVTLFILSPSGSETKEQALVPELQVGLGSVRVRTRF